MINTNPFDQSKKYRSLLTKNLQLTPKISINGIGFLCVLLNTKCPLKCMHCMFSSIHKQEKNPFLELNEHQVNQLLKLVKDANIKYFLVSSAGESFLRPKIINQIARNTSSKITWLVTSGFWGGNFLAARKIIKNIHLAFDQNTEKSHESELFIRISLDSFHLDEISPKKDRYAYLGNIIRIFHTEYSNQSNFRLMLHGLEHEMHLFEELAAYLGGEITINKNADFHETVKATEKSFYIKFHDGYFIEATLAKLLISDLSANMLDKDAVSDKIAVYDKDTNVNQKGNPGLMFNPEGALGHDIFVNFDGTVALAWQSEMPDVILTLDNTYHEMYTKTFHDLGILPTIENGINYRFSIIEEVNSSAVKQSKAINIRDYTSRILLEEDRTKLYYTVRAIQDYLTSGRLHECHLSTLPPDLVGLCKTPRENLIALYKSSKLDILMQTAEEDGEDFQSFLNEITCASSQDLEELFKKYNTLFKEHPEKHKRWLTLFERISKGWYNLTSSNKISADYAAKVASALINL